VFDTSSAIWGKLQYRSAPDSKERVGHMSTKTATVRVPEIPKASALAAHQRRGVEGICIECREPIRTHLGHKGVWRGCPADTIDPDVAFLLVPARRRTDPLPVEARREKALVVRALQRAGVPVLPVASQAQRQARADHKPTERTRTVSELSAYAVKDARVRLPKKDLTPAQVRTYSALLRAKGYLSVPDAAKAARRPCEATRRTLNELVEMGVVRREQLAISALNHHMYRKKRKVS
jgi:hypothetical protein